MDEEKKPGELADEELENVSAGMADAYIEYSEVDRGLNPTTIEKGAHVTAIVTCKRCRKRVTMDRYAYTYGPEDGRSTPYTHRIQVCQVCKKVWDWDEPGKGGC